MRRPNLDRLRRRLERLLEVQDEVVLGPGVSGLLAAAKRLENEQKAAGTWRPFSWDDVPDSTLGLTGVQLMLAQIKSGQTRRARAQREGNGWSS